MGKHDKPKPDTQPKGPPGRTDGKSDTVGGGGGGKHGKPKDK